MTLSESLFDDMDQDQLAHWMNTEGVRRLEALHANPSSGLTVDEVFEGLIDESSNDNFLKEGSHGSDTDTNDHRP
jgi:hypothetical protein